MTDSIAAIGYFQEIGHAKPANFTPVSMQQLGQSLRSHYMLQGRQSRGPGLGHALHQTTEHSSLDWRLGFSISTTLHKWITLQEGFADLFKLLYCVWPCHAPSQLRLWDNSQWKCRVQLAHLWLQLNVVFCWSAVPGSLQHTMVETLHSAGHSSRCSAAAQILPQGLRQE